MKRKTKKIHYAVGARLLRLQVQDTPVCGQRDYRATALDEKYVTCRKCKHWMAMNSELPF